MSYYLGQSCEKNRNVDLMDGEALARLETYKDVVLYPDEVAAPQVGRGKGRDEQLLGLPVVRAADLDLAPADGGQLPALRLHHLVLGDVLNCLK